MKRSFSHQVVLLILKLKGIKKTFSQSPIDVQKVRKEDVKTAKAARFKKSQYREFSIGDTTITEVKARQDSHQLLIFIHGGAFIAGPAKHHWESVRKIHKQSTFNIWLIDYPKAPEYKISNISDNIDMVYKAALSAYGEKHIILIGDSVGGSLATSLVQRCIQKSFAIPQKLILISPVMDATFSHPDIAEVEKVDPMISQAGIRSAKEMCAENGNLIDPRLSPIYGKFDHFPKTIVYLAEHDITFPDQLRLIEKLKAKQIDTAVIIGKGMPHIWPLLPVMKEAGIAFKDLIQKINSQ